MNKMFIGTILMLPVIYIGLGLSGFGNDPIESAMLFVNGNLPATALVVSVLFVMLLLGCAFNVVKLRRTKKAGYKKC